MYVCVMVGITTVILKQGYRVLVTYRVKTVTSRRKELQIPKFSAWLFEL